MSLGDVIHLINEFGFCVPSSRTRLDVVFQNRASITELGRSIAGFYPADALVVCSVPDDYPGAQAKAALRVALHAFSTVDPNVPPRWNDRVETSYWAYLGALNRLCVTKRTRRAKQRAFRGGGRLLSNVSSLGKKATKESLVRTLHVAGQKSAVDGHKGVCQ